MRRMIWYLEGEGPPADVPDTGIGPLCETVLLCVLLGVQRGSPRPAAQAAHHAGLDGAVSGAPAAPPHTGLLPSRCSVTAAGLAPLRFGSWVTGTDLHLRQVAVLVGFILGFHL